MHAGKHERVWEYAESAEERGRVWSSVQPCNHQIVAQAIRTTYILLYCAFSCFFVLFVLFEGKKVTL